MKMKNLGATSESGVSLQVNSGIDNEVVETIKKDFLRLSDGFSISIVVSHVESNEMKFLPGRPFGASALRPSADVFRAEATTMLSLFAS